MTIKATVEGRLSDVPVKRLSQSGKDWVSFSLRVGDGAEQQWVSYSAFGENVDVCAGLTKGALVRVTGKMRLNSWTGKDGRQSSGLQVSASSVEVITGSRSSGAQRKSANSAAKAGYAKPSEAADRPSVRAHVAPERGPIRQDAIPF